MDKKITQLTTASTPLSGTETLPIVQGGETVKATTQDIADLAGGGLPYQVYTILFSTSLDNNPQVVVLQNTIGSITCIKDGVGYYEFQSDSLFPLDKTFIPGGSFWNGTGTLTIPIQKNGTEISGYMMFYQSDDSICGLWFLDQAFQQAELNSLAQNCQISLEIRVYP